MAVTSPINRNLLSVSIRNLSVHCLVDTGATVSCISQSLLKKLKPAILPPFSRAEHSQIFGVGGERHPVLGTVTLPLKIADTVISQSFHVLTNPPTSVILGMDFLHANQAVLDVGNQTLQLQQNNLEMALSGPPACSVLLRTCQPVTLAPFAETVFPVKCKKRNSVHKNCCLLVEPLQKAKEKLQVLTAHLVLAADQRPVCKILNPHDFPVDIPVNFAVAKARFLPVSCIESRSADLDHCSEREACSPRSHSLPAGNALINTVNIRNPDSQPLAKAATGQASSDDVAASPPAYSLTQAERQHFSGIARDMGIDLTKADLNAEQREELMVLLGQYRDCFATKMSELGHSTVTTHDIDTGDHPPIAKPFYRQNPVMRKHTEAIIEELLSADLIYRSQSPWQSPICLVKKPGQGKDNYRLVNDYRALNKISKPASFPVATLSSVTDSLAEQKPKYFSCLDLKQGYLQFSLSPEAQEKSAFACHLGQFSWRRMSFGLRNAPATFNLAMAKVFQGMTYKQLIPYLDDIIMWSSDFDQHLRDIEEVLRRLRKHGLTLHPNKCVWAQHEVPYLGFLFNQEGVRCNPQKTAAVQSYPTPKTVKQVRAFLGLANFYRKYIYRFSVIAAPLYQLLKEEKRDDFSWTPECEQAFQALKLALVNPPVLVYPDMSKEFFLSTDACRNGIAYILSQKDDLNHDRVISYGGRSLSKCEQSYPISELEALAVVAGVKEYRHYLSHNHFTIVTDHSALTHLTNIKDTNSRLGRWSVLMEGFQYSVQYRPGKKHSNSDALSRRGYPPNDSEASLDCWPDPSICQTSVKPEATSNRKSQYLEIHFDYGQSSPTAMGSQYPTVCPVKTEDHSLEKILKDSGSQNIDLAHEQQNCPELAPLYEYLRNDQLPADAKTAKRVLLQADQFGVSSDGIMYHLYTPRARHIPKEERVVEQIVIPKSLRQGILSYFHNSLFGCHQGFLKTFWTLRNRFFWPHMYRDVSEFTQTCGECQKAKRNQSTTRSPLKPIPPAPLFGRVHMDILKLSKSKDNYSYLLVVVDSFSRWPEAIPLQKEDAATVAEALYTHVFTRYGAIKSLVSDRGAAFTGKLITGLSDLFKVKRIYTTPYHPQSNSVCERQNQAILQTLRTYGSQSVDYWPKLIPGILMAYRMTPNASGYSPYFLLHGREMTTPAELALTPKSNLPTNIKDHLSQILKNLEISQEIAEENIRLEQERQKNTYDRVFRTQTPQYHLGDRVLLQNQKPTPGIPPKMKQKFVGPFYIVDIVDNRLFKLRWCHSNKLLPSFIHHDRLKPFREGVYLTPAGNADLLQETHDVLQHGPDGDGAPAPMDSPVTSSINPIGDDSSIGSQQGPTMSQTQNMSQSQTQTQSTSTFAEVKKIIKATNYRGSKIYKVSWKDGSPSTWVKESDIAPFLVRQFHLLHSMSGRRRKRQTPSVFKRK